MTSPAGGEFRLDTELARAAIDQLRTVYAGLADLQRRAHAIARLPATAHDVVSAEAFELLRAKAAGPPGSGSFAAAMEAGMKQVESLIEQMESDIRRQGEVDEFGQQDIARS